MNFIINMSQNPLALHNFVSGSMILKIFEQTGVSNQNSLSAIIRSILLTEGALELFNK
jgi:hypothetical protein